MDLGFFVYTEDYRGNYAPWLIAEVKEDEIFTKAYSLFKDRGFNPTKRLRKEKGAHFMEQFLKLGYVTEAKMEAVLSRNSIKTEGLKPR